MGQPWLFLCLWSKCEQNLFVGQPWLFLCLWSKCEQNLFVGQSWLFFPLFLKTSFLSCFFLFLRWDSSFMFLEISIQNSMQHNWNNIVCSMKDHNHTPKSTHNIWFAKKFGLWVILLAFPRSRPAVWLEWLCVCVCVCVSDWRSTHSTVNMCLPLPTSESFHHTSLRSEAFLYFLLRS